MDKQTMNQEIKINSMSDKRDYENTFYEKLKNVIKIFISHLTYWALVIYYALQSSTLPMKDKAKIVAALAYLIFPLDLIPDAIPIVGILDDGALLYALFRLFVTIDDSVIVQAREKTRKWFGE